MSGNPKHSKWYATSKSDRKRPHIRLTLSRPALDRLKTMADEQEKSRSEVVETLIMQPGQETNEESKP